MRGQEEWALTAGGVDLRLRLRGGALLRGGWRLLLREGWDVVVRKDVEVGRPVARDDGPAGLADARDSAVLVCAVGRRGVHDMTRLGSRIAAFSPGPQPVMMSGGSIDAQMSCASGDSTSSCHHCSAPVAMAKSPMQHVELGS